MYKREEESVEGFVGSARAKEITKKTQTWMEGKY
jgi:hypothetical protein